MWRRVLVCIAVVCGACAAQSRSEPSTANPAAPAGTAAAEPAKEPMMQGGNRYPVRLETVNEQPTAVVRETAYAKNIGERIMAASPKVYEALKLANAPKPGLNVVVYLPDTGTGQWDVAPGIPIEVGVLLNEPTPALNAPVVRSTVPAGRAAVTTHWGPYEEMSAAHMAVAEWCKKNGFEPTWRNWEVYGHWSDDPAQRRTDVYYLLK